MCLTYDIYFSCHIDKYQIYKDYLEFNKYIEISQKVIRFRLNFLAEKRIFALLSEESPVRLLRCTTSTLTLYHYDTNTAPLARMICTAFTAFQSEGLHDESTTRRKSNCHSWYFSLFIIHFIIQFLQGESFNFSTFRHFDI